MYAVNFMEGENCLMKTAKQLKFKETSLCMVAIVSSMLLLFAMPAVATEATSTEATEATPTEATDATPAEATGTTPAEATKVGSGGKVSGYIENATFFRNLKGLSKFRNTAQLEFAQPIKNGFFSNLSVNGILRATYDGVYDLNASEYGPNARQAYLGQNWHSPDAVTTGSPVLGGKPLISPPVPFVAQNDPTLRRNLHGYMDKTVSDLRFPEFDDELDFIREFHIDGDYSLSNGTELSFRLGKQQVVWGKTDLFRVLDVVNPVDYSRQNIYDELQDIRIPQWILKAESRFGATGIFDELTTSIVWNFDKFRPDILGQSGTPYQMLDAGDFFSSYLNIDQHPAVGQFYPGGPVPIIHAVNLPGWKLSNTQIGGRVEGVYQNATFSLNYLHYLQQLPSLHFREHPGAPGSGLPAPDGVFDIVFPQVNLFGGAVDYYAKSIDATWRLETAYTMGEEVTRDTDGHKKTDIVRYVIGFDKNQMIPLLNSKRSFLISTQLFGQHLLNYEHDIPDYKDNWIGTLLFQGFYSYDRIVPRILLAHDFRSQGTAIAPSVDWLVTDKLKIVLGGNIKVWGAKKFDWSAGDKLLGASNLNLYEPLARFTNGPMGVANKEDEIQLTARYTF